MIWLTACCAMRKGLGRPRKCWNKVWRRLQKGDEIYVRGKITSLENRTHRQSSVIRPAWSLIKGSGSNRTGKTDVNAAGSFWSPHFFYCLNVGVTLIQNNFFIIFFYWNAEACRWRLSCPYSEIKVGLFWKSRICAERQQLFSLLQWQTRWNNSQIWWWINIRGWSEVKCADCCCTFGPLIWSVTSVLCHLAFSFSISVFC